MKSLNVVVHLCRRASQLKEENKDLKQIVKSGEVMQNRAKDAVEKIENYDKMQQELAQAYKVMKISI